MQGQRYVQPQSQMQPQPQPVAAHPVSRTPAGSQRGYFMVLIVGIIILLVGGIIFISVGFLKEPDDFDASEDYENNVRVITTLGNLIQYIGLIILSIGLLTGAVKDESLHPNVRLGMLIAMGLVVGFKLWSLYPWLS